VTLAALGNGATPEVLAEWAGPDMALLSYFLLSSLVTVLFIQFFPFCLF
jgi:hypothetical protein